jgi:hypothetical protein
MRRAMTILSEKPLTRFQTKTPVIGCGYSMLISLISYLVDDNEAKIIEIYESIIVQPRIRDFMINHIFNPHNGILLNDTDQPISRILREGNGLYPFVLVTMGSNEDDTNLYIKHYFVIAVNNDKLIMYNSYGSDYVCIPYQQIEITDNIDCLNHFASKTPDVIDFFRNYFLRDGTSHIHEETGKVYLPTKGQELEIEYFSSANVVGIYYVNNLLPFIKSFIKERQLVGGNLKRRKTKKLIKRRKTKKLIKRRNKKITKFNRV